jgi:hypothetical protein
VQCGFDLNANTVTSWHFSPQFAFGGINSAPTKYVDTVVSSHGYSNDPSFLTNGHIEVFYFTKLYGVTRWEAWYPAQQNLPSRATVTCNGSTTRVDKVIPMTRADCCDWSATEIITPAVHAIWPIPDLNLLSNFHFSGGPLPWKTADSSGLATEATVTSSATPLDTQYGKGVSYLSLSCGGNPAR